MSNQVSPSIKKIRIEKRYPSHFYIENRERAEEWLLENAPDFVIEVIREMSEFIDKNRIINNENNRIFIDEQISGNKRTS